MSIGTMKPPVLQTSSRLLVTEAAFQEFMLKNRLDEVVEGLLSNVNVKSMENLSWPAAQIKGVIHSARIPGPIRRAIIDGCQELDGAATLVWPTIIPYEVYYGLMECRHSFHLKVTGVPDTIDAVKWWWETLYDARAIHYREQAGLNHRDAAISVAIRRAGVLESESIGNRLPLMAN